MRRLLLVAMLAAVSWGAAQKRNEWSWGDDGEEAKPEEAKKVSGRSASLHDNANPPASTINRFSVVVPPHLGPAPGPHGNLGHHFTPSPGHQLGGGPGHQLGGGPGHQLGGGPGHQLGGGPGHQLGGGPALHFVGGPAPHLAGGPGHHLAGGPAPHLAGGPAPHLTGGPAPHLGGHPSVAPVVTGHQQRGEDRSLVVGHRDGKSEGRFIKEKLCEFGLAYDVSTLYKRERERDFVFSL